MKTIPMRRKGHNFQWTNFKQRRKISFVGSKSRLTSVEIIRKENTPKLLVETITFVGRYLRMTMILKESQTNKSSLV
jgi:hypothetical protein